MEVSEKLAYEISVITGSHLIAFVVLAALTAFIWFKAKKSILLNSYLALVAMIMIWLLAKIFKTVSPNETLRWFFIVLQYFGVQYLGYCLIIFAYVYITAKAVPRTMLLVLSIFPTLSFLVVATNPWHMQFYSYFDFYHDRFGPLFLPIQAGLYLYLICGAVMLARGFFRQPALEGRPRLGLLLATLTLLPLLINVYYLAFKFDLVKWIFNFPVFDITPICIASALIIFIIPAIRYRFLDILPLSYNSVIHCLPQGIALYDHHGNLVLKNRSFEIMKVSCDLDDVLTAQDQSDLDIKIRNYQNSYRLLLAKDMRELNRLQNTLSAKNVELKTNLRQLKQLQANARELNELAARRKLAQEVHDLLGHNLTVAIGLCELAAREDDPDKQMSLIIDLKQMLARSSQELHGTTTLATSRKMGSLSALNSSQLIDELKKLRSDLLEIEFEMSGQTDIIAQDLHEAVITLARETITNAIRHGQASKLHMFLRWSRKHLEIYAIDDGRGCKDISKSMGLSGIEQRFKQLGGSVSFRSDEDTGFYTHVTVPLDRQTI